MDKYIRVKNCNCISDATIEIVEKSLNIKYGSNGTGKSTISEAIYAQANNETDRLKDFKPYGSNDNSQPTVDNPYFHVVKVFNEDYVNSYLFQGDEFLDDSFQVFLKSDKCDSLAAQIERMLEELQDLINNIDAIHNLRTFLPQYTAAVKASDGTVSRRGGVAEFVNGNGGGFNHYSELKAYKPFYSRDLPSVAKWAKWRNDGIKQMCGNDCPFCTNILPSSIRSQNEIISKVFKNSALSVANAVLEYVQQAVDQGYILPDAVDVLESYIGDNTKADELCAYTPYEKGEDYKFCYFFTPNPDASWKGSSFTLINYDFNEKKEISKKYEKQEDRWARYASRPQRDTYFMGISSSIPEIELEKKTSFINYTSKKLNDKLTEKIVKDASYILNKNYEELLSHETGRKKYMGVRTKDGIVYSALSMGAGEQRVIKILQTAYSAYQYSLILIDEIDLLLHVDAFRKLIQTLSYIATDRNLQIIFTTHSLEMQHLGQYADIRYIEQQKDKMLVYNSINPDLLYKMSGEIKRKYSIYVEDGFAAAIVQKIARELNMLRHISTIIYGSAENAFTVAAGKVLSGEDTESILIVIDGAFLLSNK